MKATSNFSKLLWKTTGEDQEEEEKAKASFMGWWCAANVPWAGQTSCKKRISCRWICERDPKDLRNISSDVPGYSIHLDGRVKASTSWKGVDILILPYFAADLQKHMFQYCFILFTVPFSQTSQRHHKDSKICSDKVFKIDYFDTEFLSSLFLHLCPYIQPKTAPFPPVRFLQLCKEQIARRCFLRNVHRVFH